MIMLNTPTTMTINTMLWPIYTGTIKPDWINAARAKGFKIVARIVNRLHLALECGRCGHVNKVRLYTLTSAQPLCENCIDEPRRKDAQAAGMMYLCQDPSNRHYGIYQLKCGHEVRRQFVLIKRVVAGATSVRCETCHAAAEAAEAASLGWNLLGPDPDGNANYRLYRHTDCGHEQRIARANLQSQRFSCGNCGVDWPAAPSYIYAMRFTLVNGRELIKAGFSGNPWSRLNHQLKLDPNMPSAILRTVAVPTGHEAIRLEKSLHAELRRVHPDSVVDSASYRDQIRVTSEIYDGSLTETILAHLNKIEAQIGCRAA